MTLLRFLPNLDPLATVIKAAIKRHDKRWKSSELDQLFDNARRHGCSPLRALAELSLEKKEREKHAIHESHLVGEAAGREVDTQLIHLLYEEDLRQEVPKRLTAYDAHRATPPNSAPIQAPLLDNEDRLYQRIGEGEHLKFEMAARLGFVKLESLPEGVGDPVTDGKEGPTFLLYATMDPFDTTQYDWLLRHECGWGDKCTPLPVLALPALLLNAIQRRVREKNESHKVRTIKFDEQKEKRFLVDLENAAIPDQVEYFIFRGYRDKASDIHVEASENRLHIRFRIDGILHEQATLPALLHPAVVARIKILAKMDVAERRRPQDGRIGAVIWGNPIDIRVSSYPTVHGEKVVMRLLDRSTLIGRVADLGLTQVDQNRLRDKLAAPHGMIMLCGPTGSGKTTTLYSCLGHVDKATKNVMTVEDPVEYQIDGVNQMQVNSAIGVTFAAGLRSILRQDPDVIMVGECRDEETAAMAIQASLTGHLVLSTIHTNSAVGVINRLRDMAIDPYLIANAVSLAIAQRLVRTICKHCHEKVSGKQIWERLRSGISKEKLEKLGISVVESGQGTSGRVLDLGGEYLIGTTRNPATGDPCEHCTDGYLGRRAVFEVFMMTPEAREIITHEPFQPQELDRLVKAQGMTTLVDHGLELIALGETTFDELIRVMGEND